MERNHFAWEGVFKIKLTTALHFWRTCFSNMPYRSSLFRPTICYSVHTPVHTSVRTLGLFNYFKPLIPLSSQFKGIGSFEMLLSTLNTKFTQTVEVGLRRRESVFWPGLGLPRPKAIIVIPKNQPLPKHLREKRVKVRSTPATTLQKKDPLK